MFFSNENKGSRDMILGGCVVAAVVAAIVITLISSFWIGWFTPAALTLLWQSFVGAFAVSFLLAIVGCSEFFFWIVCAPMFVIASAFSIDGEDIEEAY